MLYLVNYKSALLAAGISEERLLDCTTNEQLAEKPLISARFRWTNHVTWYKIGRRLSDDAVNRFDNSLPFFFFFYEKNKKRTSQFKLSVVEIQSQFKVRLTITGVT